MKREADDYLGRILARAAREQALPPGTVEIRFVDEAGIGRVVRTTEERASSWLILAYRAESHRADIRRRNAEA